MYESKSSELLPAWQFRVRMLWHAGVACLIVILVMLFGMAGHMWFEPVSWHDAMLNVSLILAGVGPYMLPESVSGKLFFAVYNVLVGIVFVAIIGVILAPLAHRLLHKFHIDDED